MFFEKPKQQANIFKAGLTQLGSSIKGLIQRLEGARTNISSFRQSVADRFKGGNKAAGALMFMKNGNSDKGSQTPIA